MSSAADPVKEVKDKTKEEKKKDEDISDFIVDESKLSEEDLELKQRLDGLVASLVEASGGAAEVAALTTEVRTATSSMTSVPKPLKYLRAHYDPLVAHFETVEDAELRAAFADLLAVLSMVVVTEHRAVLGFKLQGTPDLESWGHEFIKALSSEISDEYEARKLAEAGINEDGESTPLPASGEPISYDDIFKMVEIIVPFNILHHAEAEACDLLLDTERLEMMVPLVDEQNYERVAKYLLSAANYLLEPEDTAARTVVFDIYMRMGNMPAAARVAMLLQDDQRIAAVWAKADGDELLRKQLAYMFAAQRVYLEDEEDDDLKEIMGNCGLSAMFKTLGRDLDVLEPKTPQEIYKTHLGTVTRRASNAPVDSARQNLAATFVNAFVNAGFGTDKLMTVDDASWVYKNKDHGMMSAVASLGMINIWDWEEGLPDMDRFSYSSETHIKAGAMLATGIVNAGVQTVYDMTYALLCDPIADADADDEVRIGAILGLGIAYAGQKNADSTELLLPLVTDDGISIQVAAAAALSLALIHVGACNADVAEVILQRLMFSSETDLATVHSRTLCLALGLLYLAQKEEAEVTLELAKAVPQPLTQTCELIIDGCAYAGSGNVLKVQKMLHICTEHLGEADASHQAVAVIAISLIAMGEPIGAEMALRTFNNLLQYGEIEIKRAVPLALATLHASSPKVAVIDTLGKLSHDGDHQVSQGAILALGLVGAGSNNARIAQMLRELAAYYSKEPNHLFLVQIAQGILYMGKGTMTIHPFHSDGILMSPVAMAGLLSVIFSSLAIKETILHKSHYLLYLLALPMRPRMLVVVDEEQNQIFTSVRVGKAVDTVGVPGKPKSITGFTTNDSPVLLEVGQRAELATEQYIPSTDILEGVVIVKPNPDYDADDTTQQQDAGAGVGAPSSSS